LNILLLPVAAAVEMVLQQTVAAAAAARVGISPQRVFLFLLEHQLQ
jgi:uncharacterized membrane protein